MTSTLQEVISLAASGTANITVDLNSVGGVSQSLAIGVGALYAAVAGTSGVQASFQISSNGSTFVAAALPNFVVKPAAAVQGYGEAKLAANGPLKLDAQPIVAVKITLTNLDATNGCVVALVTESSDYN
jgi:hypothetical protein